MKSILKKSIFVFLLSFFLLVQPIQAGNMNDLLMNSIVSNDMKMIQTALVNGANVNYIDPDPMWSTTPLLSAIKRENLTLIKLFLSKGADPNLSVGEGIKQKVPIIQALPSRDVTARTKNVQIMQALIDAGANINATGYNGVTPLILAVSDGSQEPYFIQFLLSKGADVRQTDSMQATPLMNLAATTYNRKNIQAQITIAKMLLQAGADPSAKDLREKNALAYAIDSKSNELIKMLLPLTKE